MRLLFEIDTKDYDPNGKAFVRPSVRGIIVRDGKVAMVHSLKYDYYKFPGGGIEDTESLEQALLREVAEESGLQVIPESIREYGLVHRVQRSDRADIFIQDNYYFLCDVEAEVQAQHLDDYEAEEHFILEFVDPSHAIHTNRYVNHGSIDQIMLEREARVLELLVQERLSNPYVQTNEQLERLCDCYNVPVQIHTIDDCSAPKFQTGDENGVHVIVLNVDKIKTAEYKANAAYHVRKALLPKLKLETERLILRRFSPKDAIACFAFLSDTDGAYMDCCEAFTSMDDEYAKVMKFYAQQETRYMIELKETSEVIGTINVFEDNSRAVESMEIGYSISPAHQRKGYAFEALSALLNLLQNKLMLDMVVAGVIEDNSKSIRLLEKLGFQKEGIRHKAIWHDVLDKPVDLIYYYRDSVSI